MEWLITFTIGFILWAFVGHLFWRVISWPFMQAYKSNCKECGGSILVTDKACRHCGWTSARIDVKRSLVICRQTLEASLKRGLIDQATVDRGLEILTQLEQRVESERQQKQEASHQVPQIKPLELPALNTSAPKEMYYKEIVPEAKLPAPADPLPTKLPIENLPSTESPKATVPEKQEVHALDRDYEVSKPIDKKVAEKPSRTWTELLSAFMEESNIRWGEIIGGLLIVCCSTALVISFWEHIASRPWLKFSIFTGINVSTFALGLYAWHRWKLPTTSKGILVIGMMQMPLNFLAFALFTLGMPWDWPTVAGEMISMMILGYLAYLTAKILTPSTLIATTCVPVAFGLANLLIRRTVDDSSDLTLLYGWAIALIAFYSIAVLWVRKPLIQEAGGSYAPALEFFAISTFGLLLSCGLLLRCSGNPMESFRSLSPLLVLLSTPALLVSLEIGRRIEKNSSLQVPMMLMGTASIAIGGLAVLLSWPAPLLMTATGIGLLGMMAVAGWLLRNESISYPASMIPIILIAMLWYGATGKLAWMNRSSVELLDALATPTTGFIWVGYSLACAILSLFVSHLNKPLLSSILLRSAWISGSIGTIVVTAFGFGREAYSTSLAALYGLYAVVTFASATVRRKPWLEILATGFLISASYQWIIVGWTSYEWTNRIFASLFCVALSLVTVLLIRHALGYRSDREQPIVNAALISLVLLAVACAFQSDSFFPLISATLLWFVFAWLTSDKLYWQTTQILAVTCSIVGVAHSCIRSEWWPVSSKAPLLGYVHPMFLQYLAITLMFGGFCSLVLAWLFQRIQGPIARGIAGPLVSMHDTSVSRLLIGAGTVLTLGIMAYGAIPGISQEILPRDALTSTQVTTFIQQGTVVERQIPDIKRLEIPGLPHSAASWGIGSNQYRIWGLPPVLAAWSLSLFSLLSLSWLLKSQEDTSWKNYAGIFAAVLISLWYPIATLSESSISVASSLRWISAFVMFFACLSLSVWIRRVDREAEPQASNSFGLFDQLFSLISIQTLFPWLGMATLVGSSALMQSDVTPGFRMLGHGFVWGVVLVMALFALVLVLLRTSAESNSNGASWSAWKIAASILLVSPLFAWTLLQVALTLISHPLTGPNPDSLFAEMGLASSHAIPILLFAVGMICVAATRPDPKLAFVAAVFLMISVVAGYLLVLKSKGLSVDSWIGLCAILSAIASIYSLVWQQITSRDGRPEKLLHWPGIDIYQVRRDLQLALGRISIGFGATGLAMILVMVLMPATSSTRLSWGAAGILTAILIHFAQACKVGQMPAPYGWIVAGGVALMGVIAPNFTNAFDALGVTALVMFTTGLTLMTIRNRSGQSNLESMHSRMALWSVLGIMLCVGLRSFSIWSPSAGSLFDSSAVPLATMLGAWGLAAGTTWLHRDRWTWAWSLALAHIGAFIYSGIHMRSAGLMPFERFGGLLLQISVAALSTAIATCSGFGRKSRIPLIVGTFLLFGISAIWLLAALSFRGANQTAFDLRWFAVAFVACLVGGITGFWNMKSKDEHVVLYLAGLSSAVWLVQFTGATSGNLFWFATIVFSAYCLASSFLWSSGSRIQEELTRLLKLPDALDKPRWLLVVPMNTLLALGVTCLGVMSQFVQESQNLRFISANAIMAVAFAIGFIARYASILGSTIPIRVLALAVGIVYGITLFWHAQPIDTPWVWRIAVASFPLVLTGALYAFGLIKWFGGKQEWEQASLILTPWLVALAILAGTTAVVMEYEQIGFTGTSTIPWYPAICLILSFTVSILLCLAAALLPGKDPLGSSERDKQGYVYAVQAILVLLVIHLRITMPFLFSGWLQSVWPLVIVGLGFAGVGFAEWSERRGWRVLSNPLRNSGSLLPLLPILAPWISPSNVDQGVTMLVSAVGYGMLGFHRASAIYITASILCANIAFWQLLHKNDFAFSRHPQLWVIPPALCVFGAGQFFKDRLSPKQLATIRYASIGSIYVASTSEIFLQGISQAPWLPMVLAVLSVLGILVGIAARIRSMLWLGSMFLAVAMFSILWYAAVDLDQTWIWYVCGIVLGAMMLFVFAMFEKRREELKHIMSNLQTWEE